MSICESVGGSMGMWSFEVEYSMHALVYVCFHSDWVGRADGKNMKDHGRLISYGSNVSGAEKASTPFYGHKHQSMAQGL